MNNLPLIEDWNHLSVVLLPFLVRCGFAAMCGALIGLERELSRKPAGFRTNILICVGASMYMVLSLLLLESGYQGIDPSRIPSYVVSGIGFLGAGSIIKAGNRVTGLTSAATIWVVAAIGLISGAGFPILASIGAIMVVTTLAVLRRIEKRWIQPASARHAGGPAEE
jgi:putative Mg2+ transporter-C (MgtC) family protein